jgi:protein-tyrosine-phosphatase
MAEAFAKIYGKGHIEAYSAGSRPSGTINPKAIDTMLEAGYDLNKHYSKSLKDIPDVEYDMVITMGCGEECPMVKAKRREDWNIPDPKAMMTEDFRMVRELIETKVKEFISNL